MSDSQSPLRLRKKHGSGKPASATPDDGRRLLDAQSFRSAVAAALIVIVVFSMFSITLSELTNRLFPWLTVVLGFLLGHAIRLAGKGIHWRFAVLAAVLAVAGSLFANIVVHASVTAEGFGVGTLEVLSEVTSMTWPVFFDEKLTVADAIYAGVAATLAAFFSTRRLSRPQYRALRLYRETDNDE